MAVYKRLGNHCREEDTARLQKISTQLWARCISATLFDASRIREKVQDIEISGRAPTKPKEHHLSSPPLLALELVLPLQAE
jgi:hypothetical protein